MRNVEVIKHILSAHKKVEKYQDRLLREIKSFIPSKTFVLHVFNKLKHKAGPTDCSWFVQSCRTVHFQHALIDFKWQPGVSKTSWKHIIDIWSLRLYSFKSQIWVWVAV